MGSSLLCLQCHACIIRLNWVVCEIGGRGCPDAASRGATSWICSKQYSWVAFFALRFIRVCMVHPYSSSATATAWKISCFILLEWSNFHMGDNLLIVVLVFLIHMFPYAFSRWDITADVMWTGLLISEKKSKLVWNKRKYFIDFLYE